MTVSRDADVIVIGSGMGGLAAAALLAKLYGRKVIVLERHFRAGGFTHTFRRPGGYEWDVGIHYVGELGRRGLLQSAMKVTTGGGLRWARMPEVYDRLVFPELEFGVRAGKQNFRDDLVATFPAEREGIERFFEDVVEASSWSTVLGMRSTAPRAVSSLASALMRRRRKLALQTTGEWLSSNIRDERLRAVLGARWGDYGLPPAQSAFFAHAVIATHYLSGAYYPVGASGGIAQGAEQVIRAAGGEVRVNAEVASIVVDRGHARGVRLKSGEELRAKVVVSDAGARTTYLRLLSEDVPVPFRSKLASVPLGLGQVSLYLGLSRSPAELGVKGENFWLHDELDHDRLFARRGELAQGRAPQVYLSFPSLKDPEAKGHTAEVITGVDGAMFAPWAGSQWMKRGDDYLALKARISEALLSAVEKRLPGMTALVSHQELSTPLSTEHFTGHRGGEIYALPATPERFDTPWLSALTPVKGLYLTGADALMLGVGGALMAGVMCAAAIEGPMTIKRMTEAANELPSPVWSAAQP